MSDEREKVLTKSEEPDVEAHKVLKSATDERATEDDSETPDVEAHKLLNKVIK
jgi:hypothetical protein